MAILFRRGLLPRKNFYIKLLDVKIQISPSNQKLGIQPSLVGRA